MRLLWAALLISGFYSPPLSATQDQNYGLSATTSGRVGSVAAEPHNPFAALYNPALLAAQPESLFGFGTSATAARFSTFKGVRLDSARFRTTDGASRSGDYTPQGHSTALWAVGMTYPFSLRGLVDRRAGLGASLSGPFQSLRTFQSQTPYDFYSLRYGTSDTQFKGTFSAAVEIIPERFYVGAGLSLFISSSGNAETTIASENPTGRFALDVGLNTAAVAGAYYRADSFQWGLVYRQEIAPQFEQRFRGSIAVGEGDAMIQPLIFRSTLYFEPHTIETEIQSDLGPLVASLGVSYQLWSRYRPSYLVAETKDARAQTLTTQEPGLRLHDTWSPRASVEMPFWERQFFASLGYRYRPSPVGDYSGAGNVLDSNTHLFGVSLQNEFAVGGGSPLRVRWGIYGQYHVMETVRVHKASADYIGAPGYEFGGHAYAYGLSLQANL